jgi:ABC-type amino acid transport substrate-binding protein/signal transduction histidine kinase/CheY-like chemotaxis protein
VRRRGNSRLAVLAALLAWLAIPTAAAGAPAPKAPVRSGSERDYSPFAMVQDDGTPDGFSVQLLRAALRAAGREVSFKVAPWSEIKGDLAAGRLEALPLVARTPEREAELDFTFPYLTMHGTVVVREDNADIRSPADLRGKRVAVLEDDAAHEYLKRANLGAVIVPLPSFAVAMRELSAGKHDAVVIQKLLAFQIMKEAGLRNLRAAGPPLAGYTQVLCFAVRKGDHELLALLNEGLSIVLADGTFRRLHAEWFSTLESEARTRSTILIGGDSGYPPYEYLDEDGRPAGFNVDLTRAVAKKMGLTVDIRLGPWNEIRGALERGEIDLVQGMFYSAERDRTIDFSPPHSFVQHVAVVRAASPAISDFPALAGKKVFVMSGDIMHDQALAQGLGERLVPVATEEEALRRLAAGELDGALVARLPALYWIEKNGWRNLAVPDQPMLSTEYGYAAIHDRDALLGAFAEGLAAVHKAGEYHVIQARWLGPYDRRAGIWTVARYVLYGALPLAALLLGSIVWSRSLRTLVVRRTQELQRKTEALEDSQRRNEGQTAVLGGIARIFREALTSPTQQDLGRICLAVAEDVTQSRFGFVGEVDGRTGLLAQLALSDPGWEECALRGPLRHGTRLAGPSRIHGVYGRVLQDSKTVVTNDPASHPDSIGTPEGHPRLEAFLGVPLTHAGSTVGILALGNRAGGYGPDQVAAAEALAPAIAQAFQSKRAEDAVRAANAQLTEADQRKSEFLAVLSHELRNPLAPIRNSLEVIELAPRGSPGEARARQIVQRQVNQLAKLVDDLLDVTRVSRGKINLSRSTVDLCELVRRTCEDHRGQLDRGRIALALDLPATPVWIDADPTRIAQVLGNLLHNAAKFTPANGSIAVTLSVAGGRARLLVRDDGVGIEPELLGRVFEPFAQAERSLARTQGGLGLGLALVKGLVELHGGSVAARSGGPGLGAELEITLPTVSAPPPAEPPAEARRAASGLVIVLIEDNVDSAHSLAELLSLHGHDVHVATGGAAGLAQIRERRPDVVLCDIGLPDLTGYEVARTVRADPELRSTYLVALSGYAQPEDRRRAAEAGFDAHLAKPAEIDELSEVVARAPRIPR